MPTLDPHPTNELGKGILDPEMEAKLLADGVIWANRVFHADGTYSLNCTFRPVMQVLTELRDHAEAYLNDRPWHSSAGLTHGKQKADRRTPKTVAAGSAFSS